MFSTDKSGGQPKIAAKAKVAGAYKAAWLMFFLIALVSCSSRIGWGVVVWTVQGTTAVSGSIVPVYLKSDITKTYVISLPDDPKSRVEVPLWQLELFGSKSAAEKRVKQFGSYVAQYMYSTRDGLPIRDKPENTAQRVYRLRDGETVKVLSKANGEQVFTGGKPLPGDWYEVLAGDGTRGYVFSYAMRMYDEKSGAQAAVQTQQPANASDADLLFSKVWRPSWYQTMLDDNTIDPDSFSLRYGLFTDGTNKQVRVELPGFSKIFQYDSITQDKDWLVFGGSGLRVKIESPTSILANWGLPDALPPDPGTDWHYGDTQARFLNISQDIREALRIEEAKRAADMKAFFKAVAFNGSSALDNAGIARFTSQNGSELRILPTGLYTWAGISAMPAGFAPDDQTGADKQNGSVVFGLHLASSMSGAWMGGFSLYSDSSGARKDYVYQLSSSGLSIAVAQTSGYSMVAQNVDQRLGTIMFAFGAK